MEERPTRCLVSAFFREGRSPDMSRPSPGEPTDADQSPRRTRSHDRIPPRRRRRRLFRIQDRQRSSRRLRRVVRSRSNEPAGSEEVRRTMRRRRACLHQKRRCLTRSGADARRKSTTRHVTRGILPGRSARKGVVPGAPRSTVQTRWRHFNQTGAWDSTDELQWRLSGHANMAPASAVDPWRPARDGSFFRKTAGVA